MKETQERQATKEASKSQPIKPISHSKQYNHIQSKIKQKLEEVYNSIHS